MLIVTKRLREHAVKNLGVAEDASDDVVRKAVSEAIMEGTLTLEKANELAKYEPTAGEARIKSLVAEEVGRQVKPIDEKIDKVLGLVSKSHTPAGTPAGETNGNGDGSAPAEGTKGAGNVETKALGDGKQAAGSTTPQGGTAATKALIGGAGTGGTVGDPNADQHRVRVKKAIERYSHSPTAAYYDTVKEDPRGGRRHVPGDLCGKQLQTSTLRPGADAPRSLDLPTERTKAIGGAWFKHMICRAYRAKGMTVPHGMRLTEHERDIVDYAAHECKFVGPLHYDDASDSADTWVNGGLLSDMHRKALLDDSGSGGLEAVPIEFDDIAIITPLLSGELFPFVDLRTVSRRRIEGFSIGNPTVSWSHPEGTAIGLFDTSAFIAAFDNNIYPMTGAMEVGLDFLADSPTNVGQLIMDGYGRRFAQELDNVVANGNGTDRPQGIFNASGITTITPAGGAGTAPQIDDYEQLLFGVEKAFRQTSDKTRGVFVGTETSYRRCRAIAVDSSDARRLFGMTHEDYKIFERPYKINESITNAQTAFVLLNWYIMYRRSGYETRIITDDAELARKNQELILVRSRWGGALSHSSAMAKTTAAQA